MEDIVQHLGTFALIQFDALIAPQSPAS